MNNRRNFAIFLDIDGTLMSGGIIPPRNQAVIAAVREQGHRVFINTGRSYACIPREVLRKITWDGVVAGIGSYVRYADAVLFSTIIPHARLVMLTRQLMETGLPCVFEGEDTLLYLNMTRQVTESPGLILNKERHFETDYRDLRMTKVTVIGRLPLPLLHSLSEAYTVFQHETYAEIAMPGCSKSRGMEIMLDHLDISQSDSIAIGDSVNDLDMLRWAGTSVAMANATADVKAGCDFVTGHAEAAGVAEALEKLVLGC